MRDRLTGIFVIATWIAATLFLCLFVRTASAYYTPLAPECYPPDWAEAGADSVEQQAIAVLTRDGRSRSTASIVRVSERETAVGFAHFTAQRDPFRLGWDRCPLDARWEKRTLAWLYAQPAARWQLETWRRIVGPVRRQARSGGCLGGCEVVVLVLANSSPRLAERLGSETDWDGELMLHRYVSSRPTLHRKRRSVALGRILR